MNRGAHAVLILDDDPAILDGLDRLLSAHGYDVRTFSQSATLLGGGRPAVPSCLILDNQLGDGMNGFEVHDELQRRGWWIPTVFLTAHWDVQAVVNAMRSGADGFLTKPFEPAAMVEAVGHALARWDAVQEQEIRAAGARAKAATLTGRERQIVKLVVGGLLNKEIAAELNLAQVTVKVHRGRAMHKLGAGNPADLARIAVLAGIAR